MRERLYLHLSITPPYDALCPSKLGHVHPVVPLSTALTERPPTVELNVVESVIVANTFPVLPL
jgi:hypothetical protein